MMPYLFLVFNVVSVVQIMKEHTDKHRVAYILLQKLP